MYFGQKRIFFLLLVLLRSFKEFLRQHKIHFWTSLPYFETKQIPPDHTISLGYWKILEKVMHILMCLSLENWNRLISSYSHHPNIVQIKDCLVLCKNENIFFHLKAKLTLVNLRKCKQLNQQCKWSLADCKALLRNRLQERSRWLFTNDWIYQVKLQA